MDFGAVLEYWFPLTYGQLNSLNRGMGLSDAYPFAVAATPAVEKKCALFMTWCVPPAPAKYGD